MLPSTLLVAVCQVAPMPEPTPTTLVHAVLDGTHVVSERGDTAEFAVLHLGGRVPYVWPLRSPGGSEVTRAFPMETGRAGEEKDHPHHRSLWFTHGSVDGHDFWHDPDCRIVLDGEPEVVQSQGPFELAITLPLIWTAPGTRVVLYERRVYRFAVRAGARLLEFESTLTAPPADVDPNGVLFGDTKEGTFGLRVRPELRLKGAVAAGSILNSVGQVDDECWGQRAQWVNYSASLGEKAIGVTVMDHTKNLRHPTWWHARDYGLVAANPFGAHGLGRGAPSAGDYRLAAGQSLMQRYLVVLSEEPLGSTKDGGGAASRAPAIQELYRWWVTLRHPR